MHSAATGPGWGHAWCTPECSMHRACQHGAKVRGQRQQQTEELRLHGVGGADAMGGEKRNRQ